MLLANCMACYLYLASVKTLQFRHQLGNHTNRQDQDNWYLTIDNHKQLQVFAIITVILQVHNYEISGWQLSQTNVTVTKVCSSINKE